MNEFAEFMRAHGWEWFQDSPEGGKWFKFDRFGEPLDKEGGVEWYRLVAEFRRRPSEDRRRIITDVLGPHFNRSEGEVPSTNKVRLIVSEERWLEVSFEGETFHVRTSTQMTIIPNSANDIKIEVREP